jgi:hypothetical protein
LGGGSNLGLKFLVFSVKIVSITHRLDRLEH